MKSGLVGRGLVAIVGRARYGVGVAWRYGLANVSRRGRDSAVQVVAFGLGITVLLAAWWLGGWLIASNPDTESFADFAPAPAFARLGDLLANSARYEGEDVLLTTRIAKVCQKKGCFFVAQHGADSVRVTFKDYGFFIPSDSGGKTVTLAGTFARKPLSPEQAAHLAEDMGEAPPENPPAFEYAIVATSAFPQCFGTCGAAVAPASVLSGSSRPRRERKSRCASAPR